METIVWTFGEKFEKTPKSQKPILNSKNEIITNITNRAEYNIKKKLKTRRARDCAGVCEAPRGLCEFRCRGKT